MARSLRVAYDVGPLLDPPTGVGRYTRELAQALPPHEVDLRRFAFALRGDEGRVGADVVRWRVPARLVRGGWRRLSFPKVEMLVGEVDVVHGTNFVLPSIRAASGVVTVHDLAFLRDDVFPGGEALRDLVPWSVERAARVLVPTRAVGAELSDHLSVDPGRIAVTPEGVGPLFFGATPLGEGALREMGIHGSFLLALGTIEPRKNLGRLLQAWSLVADRLGDRNLVLAGPAGWGEALPETPGVVPVGWVPDETLPGLLAAAEAFCYPSLYEGFGLPPLEAMAAGTPVVAGRNAVTEEVLGEAALLVDPLDVDGLAAALERVVADDGLRRRLVLQGRARAAEKTWERTARATLEAYRSAAAL